MYKFMFLSLCTSRPTTPRPNPPDSRKSLTGFTDCAPCLHLVSILKTIRPGSVLQYSFGVSTHLFSEYCNTAIFSHPSKRVSLLFTSYQPGTQPDTTKGLESCKEITYSHKHLRIEPILHVLSPHGPTLIQAPLTGRHEYSPLMRGVFISYPKREDI